MTWEAAIGNWLAGLADEMRLSPGTLTKYEQVARRYRDGVQKDTPAEVTLDDARAYIRSLSGLSSSTVRLYIAAIRSLHTHLGDTWQTRLRSPRRPERLPSALSEVEAEAILSACRMDSWSGIRDRAILEALYCSGVRASELLGVDLDDLDLTEGRFKVLGKGNRERMAFLGPDAVYAIARWLEARGDTPGALFVNERQRTRLSIMGLWKVIRARAIAAGVRRHVHAHMFRHACASHMLRHGADLRSIQLVLGHRNLNTTQIYLNLDDEYVRSVHARSHPRGRAVDTRLRMAGGTRPMDGEDDTTA